MRCALRWQRLAAETLLSSGLGAELAPVIDPGGVRGQPLQGKTRPPTGKGSERA